MKKQKTKCPPFVRMSDPEIANAFLEHRKRLDRGEFATVLRQTTPLKISPEILAFCKTIEAVHEPEFVPVQSVSGYREKFCFQNIKSHVASHGGELQHGWTIWEVPGNLIEAEFHAIWKTSLGDLIDLTEKSDGEKTILFLRDSTLVFNGERIENRRDRPMRDVREKYIPSTDEEKRHLLRYEKALQQYDQRSETDKRKIIRMVANGYHLQNGQ